MCEGRLLAACAFACESLASCWHVSCPPRCRGALAGIRRTHGDLGKHMPACCSFPEHQPVVPHSLSGELSLVSPGDVPHCCPPSYSVCPEQGAAHLSSGFSPGVEVGQEGERADGAGVLPASSLCSLVFNYVLKARQTFSVLQFPQNVFSILHMKWPGT